MPHPSFRINGFRHFRRDESREVRPFRPGPAQAEPGGIDQIGGIAELAPQPPLGAAGQPTSLESVYRKQNRRKKAAQ